MAYAELHCHTNFSFLDGASHPEELADEAARLGLAGLAVTDHDGFYGVGPLRRWRPASRRAPDRLRRRADARRSTRTPPNGERRSRRASTSWCSPRARSGTPALARAISEAQLAGEKGAPRTTLDALAARRPRAGCTSHPQPSARNDSVVRAHRVPQGRGAARALVRDGPAAARRALDRLVAAFGRDRVLVELWDHGDPLDRHRNDALAQRRGGAPASTWSPPTTCTTPRPRSARSPPRSPRSAPGARSTRSTAGSPRRRSRTCAARREQRAPVRPLARARSSAPSRSRRRARSTCGSRRPNLPDHDVPDRPHRDDAGCASSPRAARRVRYPSTHPQHEQAMRQIAYELDVIEQLGFPGYFLVLVDIVEFCRTPRHLLPGPGERGEQRGLLRARRHQGRRGRARPAVRAVPLARARRPARHRPRHRAPAPRGGDPVRLRQVRARPRRAGRQRHHLPAALGAARDGEGRRASHPATPTRSRKWIDRWGRDAARSTSLADAKAPPVPALVLDLAEPGARLPAPPRHPLGRDGDGRPAAGGVLPDRVGPHGGPLGAPVGQGRLRGRRAGEVRPARARDAHDAAPRGRPRPRARGRRGRPRHHPPGARGLRRCCARPTPSACSRWRAAPRWPRCRGCGPRASTTSWWRSRSSGPARSRAARCTRTCAAATARSRSPTRTRSSRSAWRRRSACRCSRSSSCRWRSTSPGFTPRRGRPAAPGDGLEALAGAHGRDARPAAARAWPSGASPARPPRRSRTSSRRSPTSASPRATR